MRVHSSDIPSERKPDLVTNMVLITGASSGIGRAAAHAFAAAGWQVAATMRQPEDAAELAAIDNVQIVPLDVTSPASVEQAFAAVLQAFGRIDAVVNNAGFAVDGVFEGISDEVIAEQFQVNVFGLMRVTRAAIPLMRQQHSGTILQVSSFGGRLTFPLYSVYHSTKWAVEGFSESLAFELRPFGIRVKLIEPGPIKTEFYGRSRTRVAVDHESSYALLAEQCEAVSLSAGRSGSSPNTVAATILQAATDSSWRLRYPVGPPAPLMLALRKWLPESWNLALIRSRYGIR
jgi:NAD(P)-dependent dehydrogenase (short-subunit alcohol dehydrogenase family)